MPSDLGLFLRELLRNPKMISAIAPSSRWLARAMTTGLNPGMRVVEFGPGTGVLTRAILAAGVKPANLTLFEFNPDFAAHLRRGFPGTTVINDGAQTAAAHCPPGVDAVISGLPLLSMPQDIREAVIAAAFAVLGPGGTYIQFTYGPRPPISDQQIAALGLTVTQTAHIWLNLPPARVFRFSST
jgi:phosphatidylethanolamine/phosphatidyl-N-methylethanolamine N-methyltransferase